MYTKTHAVRLYHALPNYSLLIIHYSLFFTTFIVLFLKTMKKLFRPLLLLAITILLCSWGGNGHYYISYRSSWFMPSDLLALQNWDGELSSHASDADDRKAWDETEAPRHYINYEVFPGFEANGRVYQTVDSAFSLYGASFLESNGYLPYATISTFWDLVDAFDREDDADIIYFASDLGHYVADGHMPFHLTENYNGQYTGQSGVHSRVESDLVNEYIAQITTSGGNAHYVTDVNSYIFQYQYASYKYVDSLLYNDAQAYAVSGGSYYNVNYLPTLWYRSNRQINTLFHNASQALADLIYTAAVLGGTGVDGIAEQQNQTHFQTYPNPVVAGNTFTMASDAIQQEVTVEIFDLQGHLIKKYQIENFGNTQQLSTAGLKQGAYLVRVTTGEGKESAVEIMILN